MKKFVEPKEEPRTRRLARVAGGFVMIGLMAAGAVPLGRLVIEARRSSKVAACESMERVVDHADRVALITQRSVSQSVRDHRWGEPSQREYLASATSDLRQAALQRQRDAEMLHAAFDALNCDE